MAKKGWRSESKRHSLAARGYKTKGKSRSFSQIAASPNLRIAPGHDPVGGYDFYFIKSGSDYLRDSVGNPISFESRQEAKDFMSGLKASKHTKKVHETKNYYRMRQFDPKLCERKSFRTQAIGKHGSKRVACKVKGKWKTQAILKRKKE